MRFPLVLIALLAFSRLLSGQEQNPCIAALPKDNLGAVYNILEQFNVNDWRLLRDEYAYENDWKTHEDAVHAGFSYDKDDVYLETLKIGGVFDQKHKDEWKHQFEQKRHLQASQLTQSKIVVKTLSPEFISAIGASCFSFGGWYQIIPIDSCGFTFKASYRSDKRKGDEITPTQLNINGGECDNWPKNTPLGPGGDAITCTRHGHDAVTVDLVVKEASTIHAVAAAIESNIPLEPKLSKIITSKTRDLDLISTRNYFVFDGNRECGDCKNLKLLFLLGNPMRLSQTSSISDAMEEITVAIGIDALVQTMHASQQRRNLQGFQTLQSKIVLDNLRVIFGAPATPEML